MAHQCKVRFVDPTDYNPKLIKEEIFEWATHVTTSPKEGVIVKYLDENWEEQIRYFDSKDIIAVHSR